MSRCIIIRNIFFVPISDILWTCVTWDLCSAFLLKDDASFDDGMPRLTSNTTRMTVYTVETQVIQSSQRTKRRGKKKERKKKKRLLVYQIWEHYSPSKNTRYNIRIFIAQGKNDPSNGYCIDYTSVHSFKKSLYSFDLQGWKIRMKKKNFNAIMYGERRTIISLIWMMIAHNGACHSFYHFKNDTKWARFVQRWKISV